MRRLNFITIMMSILTIGLMVISCDKDTESVPLGGKGGFLIGTTIKNADGTSGSSYMRLVPSLSGNVTNSGALPIEFGTSPYIMDNYIFTFPTFGSADSENKLKKYFYKSGEYLLAQEPQELNLPSGSGASNIIKISDDKAYVSCFGMPKLFIINPQTMKKTGEIDLSEYAYGDNSPNASNGILRDGLYYLSLNQGNAQWMPYEDHRQVDVLIIDPNTDKVVKMISETDSGLTFPTRPMAYTRDMIFTNEQNDIYIACVGYFGINPKYPQTGFVCIPSGQQAFDTSKSWDISQDTIQGTDNWRPNAIYNCKYIGNSKLAAYVGVVELMDVNNPYTVRNNVAVIIDLKTKRIKKIEGIPYTDGHSNSITIYNNRVIFGAYGKSKIGFFSYDFTNDNVEHIITTEGNPTFIEVIE